VIAVEGWSSRLPTPRRWLVVECGPGGETFRVPEQEAEMVTMLDSGRTTVMYPCQVCGETHDVELPTEKVVEMLGSGTPFRIL